ncbi:MAG: hypothetical protein AAF660_15465 [Pseudomonadota bacterium]
MTIKETAETAATDTMSDSNHIGDTVRLPRPKIETNELGHNVWTADFDDGDLELESPDVATDPYNNLKFEDY